MVGRTNAGGGGTSLSFKVVGGTSQPASPKDNTIWVNTDVPITSYVFSVTEPTGIPGLVWITTGATGSVEFNAIKKNYIQIYPISAKQYISGAWVAKTAKIYQRGAWVDLWNGELYNAGDEFTNITGGWTNSGCTYASGSTSLSVIAPKKNSTYIEFTSSESSKVCGATTDKPIDLTNYSAVHFEIETLGTGTTKRCLISKSKKLNETVANVSLRATVTTQIYTIDVSNITGMHYIGALAGNSTSCAFRLKKAWLE